MQMETYNGWTNWETWMFWEQEADAVQYSVQVGDTLEDLEDLIFTHISFLAEDLHLEDVADLTRDFVVAAYDKVNRKEIAEVLYEQLKESYELT